MQTNRILPFDEGLVQSIHINRSALEKRAQALGTRRSFKVEAQVAAYLRAIECIDLTTLAGDDTPGRVQRLCAKALNPVQRETLNMLGLEDLDLTVAAICVYHRLVYYANKYLQRRLPIAAVSTGFPAGQTPLVLKEEEIETSIGAGATEIDVVISRSLVLTGKWQALYKEIRGYRQKCGDQATLKTILGVGNLGPLENVAKAAAVAIMAGSDFIKTSTGFEPTNATLEAGLTMVRQIRRFHDMDQSVKVGFKPAGGIKTAKDAMLWMTLMLEELGDEWARPELFRLGASGLLTDLERQLWHQATGRYSAGYHHPIG